MLIFPSCRQVVVYLANIVVSSSILVIVVQTLA